MKITSLINLSAILVLSLTGNAAYSATLDFNAFPGTGNFNSISEDGYNVAGSGPGSHWISTGGSSFCGPPCPQNGTNHLLAQNGDFFTITAQDSSAFSFFSFDGAEAHEDRQSLWAVSIRATGIRADSSVVSQDFVLDWFQDGEGPGNDFQFFTASGFSNLVSLSLEGIGGSEWFTVDNINLSDPSVVPLPAAVWLFGAALIGLAGFGKRRKEA